MSTETGSELQIVRFTVPAMISIIPPILFEQLADTDPSINLAPLKECIAESMTNPNIYFFAFLDPESQQVAAFLWCTHNLIKNRLVVHGMSALPKYQQNGILHKFFGLVKDVSVRLGLDKTVELHSLHAPIPERYGGKPSRTVIYEFDTTAPDYNKERRISKETKNDLAQTEATQ